jgi:guanylate kinase
MLSEGKDVILEIDIQGGLQVKERRPDVVLAFLIPPTVEELESRLRLRGSESEMTIRKRLEIAEREYKNVSQYDYVVVNDNVEDAAARLQAILVAERCSAKRVNPKDIKKC